MSFKNIKGQDKAVNLLRAYFEQARLEGAFLFTGPEGIGKKMTAITLAKALNCDSHNSDACDVCASCKKIEAAQHPDIHLIDDSEGEIKIDFIRTLQKEISLRPYEARKKVFLIDNAHRLNQEASNALLKILEEPPKSSLIILTSDKPRLLFKTILSRCKPIKFTALPRHELEEVLANDYALGRSAAHFLSYFCEGRLGMALRLKETDFIKEKNAVIDRFVSGPKLDISGLTDKEVIRGDLNILAAWFRDVYLLKAGIDPSLAVNLDRKSDLIREEKRFSLLELDTILNTISDSILRLDQNINPRLLLFNLGAQTWKA